MDDNRLRPLGLYILIAAVCTWVLVSLAGCSADGTGEKGQTAPPAATISQARQPEQGPTVPSTASPAATATAGPALPSPTRSSATRTSSPAPTVTPTNTPSAFQVPPYGVEAVRLDNDVHPRLAEEAGVFWMRLNGLRWAAVEPKPGERNWAAVSDLEESLRANYAAGIQTVLVVRETPDWAQKVAGYSCGPVSPEEKERFALFLADAVTRYSDPPFGVKHWEIGNEPDVDPSLVAPDAAYGCWGDLESTYYGGHYYGEVLQAVYPSIKAADPEAQVLIGGLLLDREPAKDGLTNPPGRFLEGILESGGGDFFDFVSYHAYLYWDPSRTDWEMGYEVWADRGGIIVGKTEFLREVLEEHGYDKPLMLTEAGLLCYRCEYPPSDVFLRAAADYLPRMFIRNMELGLAATFWYTLDGPGWQQAGLLDAEQVPRPGYDALETMTTLLNDASFSGRLDGFRGLGGYRFERQGGEVWAAWSLDGTPIVLPVPAGFQGAYDVFGKPLSVGAETLEIGFSPIYLFVQDR